MLLEGLRRQSTRANAKGRRGGRLAYASAASGHFVVLLKAKRQAASKALKKPSERGNS